MRRYKTIGLARATAVIGLINLTYNMSRYEQIVRLNLIETKN
jgi:IS5 family transposase